MVLVQMICILFCKSSLKINDRVTHYMYALGASISFGYEKASWNSIYSVECHEACRLSVIVCIAYGTILGDVLEL